MIVETPKPLIDLLYIRAVCALPVGDDVPPADPPPDRGDARPPAGVDVISRWERLWQQAVNHLGDPQPGDTWGLVHGFDGLDATALREWRKAFGRTSREARG